MAMAVDKVTGYPCEYFTYVTTSECACFNLKWTFKNYSKLKLNTDYKIPSLRSAPLCDWELSFRKEASNLYLYVENKIKSDLKLSVIITICDDEGKQVYQRIKNDISLNCKSDIMPIVGDEMYKKLNALPKDSVTLDLEFKVGSFEEWKTVDESFTKNLESDSKIKALGDLKKFVLDKHPSEVILKTKDAQLSANKLILCARSPVFGRMFENPMSENDNHTVLIDDLMGATVKNLIDFLYTGEVDFNIEFSGLKELYYAADKYDVPDLLQMCSANILSRLTEENVCGLLELAQEHSDEHLKKSCMKFFQRCYQKVMGTESWKQLKSSDPSLSVELLEVCLRGSVSV